MADSGAGGTTGAEGGADAAQGEPDSVVLRVEDADAGAPEGREGHDVFAQPPAPAGASAEPTTGTTASAPWPSLATGVMALLTTQRAVGARVQPCPQPARRGGRRSRHASTRPSTPPPVLQTSFPVQVGKAPLTRSSRSAFDLETRMRERRERAIEALARKEPDFRQANLRRLFRLMDHDRDRRLSTAEFYDGLLSMGLTIDDPYVVGQLMVEADLTNSGYVDEEEFIQFFLHSRLHDLKHKVTAYSTHRRSAVGVLEYGLLPDAVHELPLRETFDADAFNLDTAPGPGVVRWIDVRGYDLDLMRLLGAYFDLNSRAVQDPGILQANKIEMLSDDTCQILVSAADLEDVPFAQPTDEAPRRCWRSPSAWLSACAGLALPSAKTDRFLVSKHVLDKHPPYLHKAQLCILIVGQSTILTVIREYGLDFASPEVLDNPLCDILDEAACSIKEGDPVLHSAPVNYLAFTMFEQVLEHNYHIRDILKEWIECVDDAISEQPESKHVAHLYDFSKVATSYVAHLEGLAAALKPQNWEKDPRLVKFFKDQDFLFRDVSDTLTNLMAEVTGMTERTDALFRLYQTKQEDRNNRVLYILTLVTTVFVPAQFLTGIWGMNFQEMPELEWRYGYLFFWLLVVVLSLLVVLCFRYQRFFG